MNEEDSLPPVLDVPTCDITTQYREGKGFYIHLDLSGVEQAAFTRKSREIFQPGCDLLLNTGQRHSIIPLAGLVTQGVIEDYYNMSWDTLGVESILIPMYATKKVMGYLVRLDNVKLGSVTFSKFYCYVVPNRKFTSFWLGLDFISHCLFTRVPGAGIEITLNKEAYTKYYETYASYSYFDLMCRVGVIPSGKKSCKPVKPSSISYSEAIRFEKEHINSEKKSTVEKVKVVEILDSNGNILYKPKRTFGDLLSSIVTIAVWIFNVCFLLAFLMEYFA